MTSGAGVKGLLELWVFLDPTCSGTGLYTVLNALGDGFYYFLPIMLGYSAASKFKLDPFMDMGIGAALVYPEIVAMTSTEVLGTLFEGTPFAMSYYTTILGIPLIMPAAGYTSSVVPVILATWIAARVDNAIRPKLPDSLRFFTAPFIDLVCVRLATFLVIGPVAQFICSLIVILFNLISNPPVVGGLLMGAFVGAI